MWLGVALLVLLAWSAPVRAERRARWQELPLPPAMPKPASHGQVATKDGAQIYYATYGDGAPVILLHGGLGNGDHFAFQLPALVDHFRAIAIDSRGHGRSTLGKAKPTYRQMAADVVAVMDALRIERASIVGWSDGGAVALALGIEHAARVDRLFVLGTNYDAKGMKPRPRSSKTFEDYGAKCSADYRRLSKSPKSYAATARAMLPVWRDPAPFTRDELRAIAAPTLIADGAHDEIVALDQVKEMARLIPNAQLVVFEDTSHFALWQDPANVNRALVEFLSAAAPSR